MTVDYKPLANNGGANVITQAAYLTLLGAGGALENGYQSGVVPSDQFNKVLRQSSVMTAAVAELVANALRGDLLDDGDVDALVGKIQSALGTTVANVADLRSLPVPQLPAGRTMIVDLSGYTTAGDFGGGEVYWAGNSNEADNGITVFTPNSAPATGRWKRAWFGTLTPEQGGAKGDNATNDTTAMQRIGTAITANGGGTVVLRPGATYIVGRQQFAGAFGLGYAYRGEDVLTFTNCTRGVVIAGNGACLKVAAGLKYGAFNPVTGAPFASTSPFFDTDYLSDVNQWGLIFTDTCSSVVINDLELDGNNMNLQIGGPWGDVNIQAPAAGIWTQKSKMFATRNVNSHHHGLDGMVVAWTGLTETDSKYPHVIINSRNEYNGRQGLSWVGGNSLTIIGGSFNNTGRAVNAGTGTELASLPSAGIDIEAENAVCRNGLFMDFECSNNVGPQVLFAESNSKFHTVQRAKLVGTTVWSLWGTADFLRFEDCLFAGSVVNVRGSAPEALGAAQFRNCHFTHDLAYSPNGQLFGDFQNLDGTQNVLLDACTFDAGLRNLPFSIGGLGGTNYQNCHFYQSTVGTGTSFTRGCFLGGTVFNAIGTLDLFGSTNYGTLSINGVLQSQQFETSLNTGGDAIIKSSVAGWGSPTGTATRTAFDTATVTTAQLAERVKALLDDVRVDGGHHGLIKT